MWRPTGSGKSYLVPGPTYEMDQYGQAMQELYARQDARPDTGPAWAGFMAATFGLATYVGIRTHDGWYVIAALGLGMIVNAAAATAYGLWVLWLAPKWRRDS